MATPEQPSASADSAVTGRSQALTAPPGRCCRCGHEASERLTVAIVHANSGPGWSKGACVPCTRVYARSLFAPTWLRESLAAYDLRQNDR